MDYWRLLNDFRRSVYCGKKGDHQEKLDLLLFVASKRKDTQFSKNVLLLKREIDSGSISARQKFLWLTSVLREDFYPPLSVDEAGPAPLDDKPHVLAFKSAELGSRYPLGSFLRAETETELQQCQDIDDCSLIASLIGMKVQGISRPMVRQISASLFMVNLHFNGAIRLITVNVSDVPTDPEGRQLSVHGGDLIDKVIEMAYLQVTAGSYETMGSNCAVDMFRLAGFLPQILNARDCSVKQLMKYFRTGLCVIALGTGSTLSEGSQPLIENHDYPVVKLDEAAGCLMVRDPIDPALCLGVSEVDLAKHYEQVYISWCHSKLFAYKRSSHFFYNAENCNRFNSVADKPLFNLTNKSKLKEPVRILLETHLDGKHPNTGIAYIKELSNSVLFDTSGGPAGATNMGLQLLEYELDPGQNLKLFCHSSTSSAFSVNVFSNSEQVSITRETKHSDFKALEFEPSFTGDTNSFEYFRNPTMALRVASATNEEVAVYLQLLSESADDMINFQVYAMDDHTLTRPITSEVRYEAQKYDLKNQVLMSNLSYKVICSCYGECNSNKYKIIAAVATSGRRSSYPTINLSRVYLEFGSHPYHLERLLAWPRDTNRTKVHLTTKRNTQCFIRIVPHVKSPLLSIRCNVYDGENHDRLYGASDFIKPGPAGLVIDRLEILDCSYLVLLIEKDEPRFAGEKMPSVPFKLLIGSQSKVSFRDQQPA